MGIYRYLHYGVDLRLYRFALCFLNGSINHFAVQIISDLRHVSVLFRAENIPRTPNLKIAHCNTEARTELRELFYCRQAFIGNLAENFILTECEVGITEPCASSDSSAELIKL